MATISQLIERGKEHADMVESDFVEDATWLIWANVAYARLYIMLANKFAEYFVGPVQPMTIDSSGIAALPNDFLMLRAIDKEVGAGSWKPVKKFNFHERNSRGGVSGYRLSGNTLLINGTHPSGNYQIFYVKQPDQNKALSYSLEHELVPWEEWIALQIGILALGKEESSFSHLEKLQKPIEEEIDETARNRDIGGVERITDLRSRECYWDNFNDDPDYY